MRRGNNPQLYFAPSGQLMAFATGSDSTAEHECGSASLQAALINADFDEQSLIEKLRKGRPVTYPSLAERKRIAPTNKRNALARSGKGLEFFAVPASGDKPAQAVLGISRQNLLHYKDELEFPVHRSKSDPDLAGAWDEESFAIRVRGAERVAALREFYEAMQAGECLFAGTFFKEPAMAGPAGGVVIAREALLNPESVAHMQTAQREYESKLRLQAASDLPKLREDMKKAARAGDSYRDPGFFWTSWVDKEESGIVYCLNPGYEVKADYLGPYTREQLLDWAAKNFKYHLKPLQREAA